MQGWLDQIAVKDPKLAYDCFMDVVEYHVPKLQRTEVTGKDEGPLQVEDVTNRVLAHISTEALEAVLAKPENNGG